MRVLCPDYRILYSLFAVIIFSEGHRQCNPRYAALSDLLLLCLGPTFSSADSSEVPSFHFYLKMGEEISHMCKITAVSIGRNQASYSLLFPLHLDDHFPCSVPI
jgi:hypothetical protein